MNMLLKTYFFALLTALLTASPFVTFRRALLDLAYQLGTSVRLFVFVVMLLVFYLNSAKAEAQGVQLNFSQLNLEITTLADLQSSDTNLTDNYEYIKGTCADKTGKILSNASNLTNNLKLRAIAGDKQISQNELSSGVQEISDSAAKYFSLREFDLNSSWKIFEALKRDCVAACSKPLKNPSANSESNLNIFNKQKEVIVQYIENCQKKVGLGISHLQTNTATAAYFKKSMSTLGKVALGAGAVGGTLLLVDHINDKKKEKREERKKEEAERYANGVIKDSNGNDIQCFSSEHYMRVECNETMLRLCQGDKSETGGCRSFNAAYCANAGSGSQYCLYAQAKTYCAQQGSVIGQSPACQWAQSRSDECKKNPEQVSCLLAESPQNLTAKCNGFPNDPICSAHANGRIVVQGAYTPVSNMASVSDIEYGDTSASAYQGAAHSATQVGSSASTATSAASGTTTTMSQFVGSGSSVGSSSVGSSSVASPGEATVTSSAQPTPFRQPSSQPPNAEASSGKLLEPHQNIFQVSSQMSQKACLDGRLMDCN